MPQPTSAESDDNRACFGFPAIAGKKFSAGFDGGRLTSDSGVLLLGQAERQMGIAKRLAACIARSARPKPRHPRQGGHPARSDAGDCLRLKCRAIVSVLQKGRTRPAALPS